MKLNIILFLVVVAGVLFIALPFIFETGAIAAGSKAINKGGNDDEKENETEKDE